MCKQREILPVLNFKGRFLEFQFERSCVFVSGDEEGELGDES